MVVGTGGQRETGPAGLGEMEKVSFHINLCASLRLLYLLYELPMLLFLRLACDSSDSVLLPSILFAPQILPSFRSTSFLLTMRVAYLCGVYRRIIPQHVRKIRF